MGLVVPSLGGGGRAEELQKVGGGPALKWQLEGRRRSRGTCTNDARLKRTAIDGFR